MDRFKKSSELLTNLVTECSRLYYLDRWYCKIGSNGGSVNCGVDFTIRIVLFNFYFSFHENLKNLHQDISWLPFHPFLFWSHILASIVVLSESLSISTSVKKKKTYGLLTRGFRDDSYVVTRPQFFFFFIFFNKLKKKKFGYCRVACSLFL